MVTNDLLGIKLSKIVKTKRERFCIPPTIKPSSQLDFSSNDYLNLSQHPFIIEASLKAIQQQGVGSTGSRLITGTTDEILKLEKHLAEVKNKPCAMVFNSGFQMNATVLATLTGRQSYIISDKAIHASLLHGILVSQANHLRFRHNDLQHLENLLKDLPKEADKWIVAESLYSMHGDQAPLSAIIDLAQHYNAKLYIDEAHAFGIYGLYGYGLTEGVEDHIDIIAGTFGKACGSFGAFLTTNETIARILTSSCPGFIFTTALPPSVIAAVTEAIKLIPKLHTERQHLLLISQYLREKLSFYNINYLPSEGPIVPILIKDEQKTLQIAQQLKDNNIELKGIIPPTVPSTMSLLRITCHANHSTQNIDFLVDLIQKKTKFEINLSSKFPHYLIY